MGVGVGVGVVNSKDSEQCHSTALPGPKMNRDHLMKDNHYRSLDLQDLVDWAHCAVILL